MSRRHRPDWTYVGFDLLRLEPGEEAGGRPATREVCLVLIAGKAEVSAGEQEFGVIGERTGPFDGKPWSVYVPAGSGWRAVADDARRARRVLRAREGGWLAAPDRARDR